MILVKTAAGHQVVKDRSVTLTPRQRSALILVDGKRSVDEVVAATAAAGTGREDIDRLVELGLVSDAQPAVTAAEDAAVVAQAESVKQHKERPPQQRYAEAYPIAIKLTSGLGLRGFRLNLAVEAAGTYEQLAVLAPKILNAVGPDKYQPLDDALNDR